MEIEYSYRIEDFEEICEAADKKTPKQRQMRIAYILLGAALLAAPFFAGRSFNHPEQFLLGISLMGFLFIYFGLQNPRRTARKYYRNFPQSTYKAVISEAGIVTISPTVRTELQWAAFSNCIYSDNALALDYEAVMYMFPRRAFSDEQWTEFRRLIERNVKSAQVGN